MADPILPARGFRDILPAEKAKREAVLASIRRSYSRFGFTEIETPAMEPIERLSSDQGGENEKLVFKVMRRGLAADDEVRVGDACDLGMRYDLTVPLVRYYATHSHELPAVFRALQIGPVWRAERPQKGRYRQFLQCDIDILGESSIIAEIELVNATLTALDDLGITDTTVRLNDRRVLDSLLTSFGVAAESKGRALIIIDKLDKIGVSGVRDALVESDFGEQTADAVAAFLTEFTGTDGTDIEQVASLLPDDIDAAGLRAVRDIAEAVSLARGADARVVFDPTLVRGMGYYTGPIFEVAHPSSTSSICGGGRYDHMGEQVFGRAVPACGFSIGFERVIGLVDESVLPESEPMLAIVYRDTPPAVLASLQARYVRQGRRVLLARRAKNFPRQLRDLAMQGATALCTIDADSTATDTLVERPIDEPRKDGANT